MLPIPVAMGLLDIPVQGLLGTCIQHVMVVSMGVLATSALHDDVSNVKQSVVGSFGPGDGVAYFPIG